MAEEPDRDHVDLLLRFLRDRDVACPICGYNLRRLTQPKCPECQWRLELTVGARRPRMIWFLITLAPSIFSGIAAGLLLLPILLAAPSPPLWPVITIDLFGWLSGLAGLALVGARFKFMAMPLGLQQLFASSTWLLHVAMAVLLACTV
ncbi:MAG: hypothetical protein ACYTJ0_21010 [Planctomycetota bacterium]|jgi:hypothetical protein